MKKAEFEYKGNKYNVLALSQMKNPQTRSWDKAVIYCPVGEPHKLFVRELEEFFKRFKMVMDGFAPEDIEIATREWMPDDKAMLVKYGMPIVHPDNVLLTNMKKGNDNGKTQQGKESSSEGTSSHSTEKG